jgi:SSS family solute:Na+ symporter
MIDVAVFFLFLIAVLIVGIGMSRRGKGAGENSEAYFLAGRGLAWWLIGISLISANISAEQFVGMPGQAARDIGLAIASYEWIAAVALVIVAFIFLPRFLKAGVYTVPQFLETRYNRLCRTLMSLSLLAIYAFVTITAVNYAGAKAFSDFFGGQKILGLELNLVSFCWILGIFASIYVLYGGLKAAAWAGSLQGTALILCGVVILYFAMGALEKADTPTLQSAMSALEFSPERQAELLPKLENAGAVERFTLLNHDKLRMNLPWTHTIIPITALLFGIWIPNLYYWGLDQHIMQRTLGSQSLSQGQKGIVLAAFLKLIIPFIVIFPGLIAFNLYSETMKEKAFEGKGGFEALKAEREKFGQLFDFDDKFAAFKPEAALKMIQFNAEKEGLQVPQNAGKDPLAAHHALKNEIEQKLQSGQSEWVKPFIKPSYGKLVSGYDYDSAFGLLLYNLVPSGGLLGFALAALFGMVVSAMAAMLNAVSTLFSIDIYKEFLHRKASEKELVLVGRISVVGFMILACALVPVLDNPRFGGIFTFIQEFQGFISPGILVAFLFGFFVHRAPKWSGVVALILSPAIYGALMVFKPATSFLDRMSMTFCAIVVVMLLLRLLFPMKEAFKLKSNTTMDLRTSKIAVVFGILVVIITAVLYAYFWDYNTPMFDGFLASLLKK